MAAATFLIGTIEGCTLTANYDDVTLLCGSLTFNNAQGLRTCVCSFTTFAGITESIQSSPGGTAQMTFSPAINVITINQPNGKTHLSVQMQKFSFQALPI